MFWTITINIGKLLTKKFMLQKFQQSRWKHIIYEFYVRWICLICTYIISSSRIYTDVFCTNCYAVHYIHILITDCFVYLIMIWSLRLGSPLKRGACSFNASNHISGVSSDPCLPYSQFCFLSKIDEIDHCSLRSHFLQCQSCNSS